RLLLAYPSSGSSPSPVFAPIGTAKHCCPRLGYDDPVVTWLDLIALGIVALAALGGLRRGLILTTLSLVGLLAGAYLGARIGPALLSGGADSAYTPVAALLGAFVGAVLLGTISSALGLRASRTVDRVAVVRALDGAGGLVAGAAWGLVVVWVAAA